MTVFNETGKSLANKTIEEVNGYDPGSIAMEQIDVIEAIDLKVFFIT